MSSVRIRLGELVIAYLTWDESNGHGILELEDEYMASAIDVAPLTIDKSVRIHYANKEPFGGLHAFVADSLPDHFGNRLFQEWLIQMGYAQADLNPVDRLMYIASRGMGGLVFEPAQELASSISVIDLNELAAISDKVIKDQYAHSDFVDDELALQRILRIGSSVGGAQPKVLIAKHAVSGVLLPGDIIHADSAFNYYIVKLAHDTGSSWGQEKTVVEYIYHKMALRAGINMPAYALIEEGSSRHLMIERFDRIGGERIHMQTLLAMSGYHNKRVPFSYEDCFRIMEKLRMSHADKEALFRQLVFNVLSCNMDDHTKNISFVMEVNGEWRLSPAYDLTYPFDPSMPFFRIHKMSINGKVKDIRANDLLAVAKKVGIRNAKGILTQVAAALSDFALLAREYGLSERSAEFIQKDIEARVGA